MRALVLSGGGARGAYEAGVIRGLATAGEEFEVVCGTSIGAINASFFAQDLLPDLEQLWKSIASRRAVTLIPVAQRIQEFVTGFEDFQKLPTDAKLFRIPHLIELYGSIGSKVALLSLLSVLDRMPITAILSGRLNVNNLKRSLIVSATNITQEQSESFYAFIGDDATTVQQRFVSSVGSDAVHQLTNVNFLSAVEASAAIPLAFAPVPFNHGTNRDFLYVDGGVANNTPIGLAIAAGASDVTVIFMDPEITAPPHQPIPNAALLGMACYDVMQQKILASDMKLALMTNRALTGPSKDNDPALAGKVDVRLREVRPQKALDLSILAFDDQTRLNAAFELGRQDARRIKTLWPPMA